MKHPFEFLSSDPAKRAEQQMLHAFKRAGYGRLPTLGERVENAMAKWGLLHRMSFLTGTSVELLYASIAPGTTLATFTTEDNLQKTLPPIIIPAGFFYNLSAAGKSLKIKARGRLSTTGGPTFTWTARLLTSTTWSAGGLLLGSTAALTAGTGVTLAPWVLDIDVTMRTLGIAGASTIAALGEVRGPLALASPFGGSIPASNTAFTVTTLDNSVTYYLFLSAACGTSSGSNTITAEMIKVYGE